MVESAKCAWDGGVLRIGLANLAVVFRGIGVSVFRSYSFCELIRLYFMYFFIFNRRTLVVK